MRGRIYFIGSGTGDPALMTIKGMELLKSASLVLVPGFFKETYAEYLKGKEWFDPFDFYHADLVAKVDACWTADGTQPSLSLATWLYFRLYSHL